MNFKAGDFAKLTDSVIGETNKLNKGTELFIRYVFPEAELVGACEVGQTQLNIIPFDKLELIEEKLKINSKVNYLISKHEAFGCGEGGVVQGTLKAYDKERNIGLIYFGGSKRNGTCGCYSFVRKLPNKYQNKTVFAQYSDNTWVNIE